MAKHDVVNTDAEREEFIAIARELAPEFAKRGKDADANNEFPKDTIPLYKASGLAKLGVPKELGGMGADIRSIAEVTRTLVREGDPAIALSYNMHHITVGLVTGVMDPKSRDETLSRIAEENLLMCGPFSEERAGVLGLSDTTAVLQEDGGYVINGKKTWSTLAEAADLLAFNAAVVDENGLSEDLMQRTMAEAVFLIPMDTQGVEIKLTWDTMGMRATGTQTTLFKDAKVPAEAVCGDFRMGLLGSYEWVAIPFAAAYLGLAEKAYEACREELKTKSLGAMAEGADVKLSGLGYVQYKLGRMCYELEVAKRAFDGTVEIVLSGRDAEFNPMARHAFLDIAKVIATETAVKMTDGALRLVGGNTYRRGQLFERLYRDARAGPFHVLTTDQDWDILGRSELGLMPMPEAPAEPEPVAAG